MAGPVVVEVGKVPGGEVKKYAIDGQPTVEKALEAHGLKMEAGDEVRVNGEPAGLNTELHNGDVVLLVPRVKGA